MDIPEYMHKLIYSIAKLTLALGIIGTIIYLTPIFDILNMFLYIVLVPLALLAATGTISLETIKSTKIILDELKPRVAKMRTQIVKEKINALA